MQNYNPGYMALSPQYQAPEDRVLGVAGLDAVKAYPMPPSSRFVFFDENEDVCYIKTTDSNSAYSIIIFDMVKREMPSEYVSRAEYDELKSMLQEVLNAQQSVPVQAEVLPNQ